MSYPVGFDEAPLAPIIIIKDQNGVEKYRYEHDVVVAGPATREFSLVSWFIEGGINSNHGMCQILIDDRDNQLLDTTKNRKSIKIKNSWELIANLGKDSSNVNTWFDGIIEEPELIRVGTNLQYLLITAFGWGLRTAHRTGRIERSQAKLSDGLNADDTDNTAKVSELFKDVLEDTDVPAFKGLGTESITTGGVDDIDVKLPDYQRQFQSFALMLNELSAIPGAIYGIDPDKEAFLRLRGTTPSGFLITNDTENPSILTRNWNQDKILFMRNSSYRRKESTIESGYTVAEMVGAQHPDIDHENTAANAVIDLSGNSFAFEFQPDGDNVSKISAFLSKVGTPASRNDLHCCIVGEASGGGPDSTIRQRLIIPGSFLESKLDVAKYFERKFDKIPATHGEKLYLVFSKYSDGTNPIKIDYQTGTGVYYEKVSGVWTLKTGDAKFRTYTNKTMHIIAQNCVARKTLRAKEMTVSMTDFPDEETALIACEGILDTAGKIKALYSPLVVSAPTDRIDLGKTAKFIDVFNEVDVDLDVIGYTISGSAFDDSNLGAKDITILVEEWFL